MDLPRPHEGTADDPIPLSLAESFHGVMAAGEERLPPWMTYIRPHDWTGEIPDWSSPFLAEDRSFGKPMAWLEVMSEPFPIPGARIFKLDPGGGGEALLEARSMDFDTGLRISRVMRGGEVIPFAFNDNGDDSYYGFYDGRTLTDSQLQTRLEKGEEYRVELFAWTPATGPVPAGTFTLEAAWKEISRPLEPPTADAQEGVPIWKVREDYLRRVAERARTRGNEVRGCRALLFLAATITEATPVGQDSRWGTEKSRLREASAYLDRAGEILTKNREIPLVEEFYWVRRLLLHRLGAHEEAKRTWKLERPAQEMKLFRAQEGLARDGGDTDQLALALLNQMRLHFEAYEDDDLDVREEEILRLLESPEPSPDLLVAKTLNWLAFMAERRGRTDRAEELRKRVRALLTRRWDALEESVARAGQPVALWTLLVERRGWASWYRGAVEPGEERESHLRRLEAIAEAQFASDDERRALTLLLRRDDLTDVTRRADEALAILERLHAPGDLRDVSARVIMEFDRINLGYPGIRPPRWAYRNVGRPSDGKRLLERLLMRCRDVHGDASWSVSWHSTYLSLTLAELGDYETAAGLSKKVIALEEATGHPIGNDQLVSVMSLVEASVAMGDVSGLAGLTETLVTRAEERFEQENRRDREYSWLPWKLWFWLEIASSKSDDAKVQWALGNLSTARDRYEGILGLMKSRNFAHLDQLRCFVPTELAALNWELGDARKARLYLDEGLPACEATLGAKSSYSRTARNLMSGVLAETGDPGAMSSALQSARDWVRYVRLGAMGLSERRALGLSRSNDHYMVPSSRMLPGLHVALSLLAAEPAARREFGAAILDAEIGIRAVVQDLLAGRNRSLSEARWNPEIAELAGRYQTATARLAQLLVQTTADAKVMEAARREMEQAEESLAVRSAEFRNARRVREATLSDVAGALPAGSALVSYVKFDKLDLEAPSSTARHEAHRERISPHYAAFVLHPGSEAPAFVDLGRAEVIDGLVSRWRGVLLDAQVALRGMGAIATAKRARAVSPIGKFREAGAVLREAIWDPVAKHVGNARRVFLVPDGALNLVSFAALPDGDAAWLVESGPLLHYLSAERDLVRALIRESTRPDAPTSARTPGSRTLLALGGVDFDATDAFVALRPGGAGRADAVVAVSPTVGHEESAPLAASGSPASTDSGVRVATGTTQEKPGGPPVVAFNPLQTTFRGPRSGCGAFEDHAFPPLEATATEVLEIAAMTCGSLSTTMLLGARATETAFKQQAPGSTIVHLATHGFFLEGSCRSALDSGRGVGGVASAENPLILSGLALAGANHRDAARPDEDDGILTAQEIAAMDLSSVEWAVLSACETGVGEIRAGEGVFGLRRAFQVAGADTLIMSLWSVDDEAARAWMEALYEGRLERGLDTAEAVRQASLTVLEDRRAKGLSDHPFYWAAFVAAGDWR